MSGTPDADERASIATTARYFDNLLARIPAAAYYSAEERREERLSKVKPGSNVGT
jgi:hypothetical protein